MSRIPWRTALSGAVIVALLATTPPAASARSSTNELLKELVGGSSQATGSTGSSVDAALGSAGLLGPSDLSSGVPPLFPEEDYPLPTDPSITEVELRDVEVDDRADRLERWHVASPSMKRVVEVQVMRPADPNAAAPTLYLLDGVGGNRHSSGWINDGVGPEVFAKENVTVVMPLGAAASMYSDWQDYDPALGQMKWETFLIEELAPLLESRDELNFNGHRGIGGLSMGATGAVHLANSNPGFFDGVMGISGCYSTLDELGRATVELIVGSRGGDPENMWGPFGSDTWREHDVTVDPSGLRDTAVYLSAATGALSREDREQYADAPFYNMVSGVLLERGSLDCTRNLDNAMTAAGMTHQVVDYQPEGMHNWANFAQRLQPGWDTIKPRSTDEKWVVIGRLHRECLSDQGE